MRHLSAERLGLGFWSTGSESDWLLSHVDVTGFEETFHVERRARDALQEVTRGRGIDVRTDVTVDAAGSELAGEDQVVACDTAAEPHPPPTPSTADALPSRSKPKGGAWPHQRHHGELRATAGDALEGRSGARRLATTRSGRAAAGRSLVRRFIPHRVVCARA